MLLALEYNCRGYSAYFLMRFRYCQVMEAIKNNNMLKVYRNILYNMVCVITIFCTYF